MYSYRNFIIQHTHTHTHTRARALSQGGWALWRRNFTVPYSSAQNLEYTNFISAEEYSPPYNIYDIKSSDIEDLALEL